MFSAALAPSGTYPPGLQWPADPQWGNFVEAFKSAKLDRLLLSSLTIVACVVPVSVLIGTMAGFGLAKLAPRGSQFVYLLFVVGLTLPLRSGDHPALLRNPVARSAQHQVRDHPAPDRPLHAVLDLLDARAFRERAGRDERGRRDRRRERAGSNSGSSRCRWRGRRSCRWRSCSSCGPGTRSSCRWCWWKCRSSARWPERLARSRASGAPISRCSAPARC